MRYHTMFMWRLFRIVIETMLICQQKIENFFTVINKYNIIHAYY